MTDQQLYFAIGVPVFTVVFGMAMNILVIVWQSAQLRNHADARFAAVDVRFKGVEDRLDKIERTLELIQADLKEFYRDVTRLKQKTGLD
jgi:hypothetical protein